MPRNLSSHLFYEKNVKGRKSNTQFYTVSVRTYVIPFNYGSGSGSSSGSTTLKETICDVPLNRS
jgi:hypothetical protein